MIDERDLAIWDDGVIGPIIAELATPSNQVGPLDRPYRRVPDRGLHFAANMTTLGPDNFLRDWYGHLTNQGAHRRRVVCGLHTVKKPDGRTGPQQRMRPGCGGSAWPWRSPIGSGKNAAT